MYARNKTAAVYIFKRALCNFGYSELGGGGGGGHFSRAMNKRCVV